jgi:Tol biopolymer transport system component
MPDGEPHPLTDGEIPSVHPRWSPKGDEIVFGRGEDWHQNILSVSPFGGTPRLLIEGGRNPSWSPDGSRLVYEKDNEIWTANADGSGQQQLVGVPRIDLLVVDREPCFSPDGSQIAFFQPEDGPMGDIWVIPSRGGQTRQLTFDNHLGGGLVWKNDGYIVFSSQRRGSKTLWKIPESGGTPQPMTVGAGEDTSPEISHDGTTLIYTNSSVYWTLTVLDSATQGKQEIRETRTDMYFPKFSPAGDKIAFFATVDDGDIHIFTIRVDGSDLRQVTRGTGERNVMPQWSANGANLYFYQIRPGLSFRKISVEGGASSEIASGWRPRTQYLARVDPTEKNVVYSKLEKGTSVATIIRDIATRKETPFKQTLDLARWSPDGRSVVGVDPASSVDGGAHGDILVCPVDTGACRKVASNGQFPIWSADDSQIYFERNRSEIWSVSSDGGKEKPVVQRSQVDPIAGEYDVSNHGKIVYVQFKQGKQGLWMADLR